MGGGGGWGKGGEAFSIHEMDTFVSLLKNPIDHSWNKTRSNPQSFCGRESNGHSGHTSLFRKAEKATHLQIHLLSSRWLGSSALRVEQRQSHQHQHGTMHGTTVTKTQEFPLPARLSGSAGRCFVMGLLCALWMGEQHRGAPPARSLKH